MLGERLNPRKLVESFKYAVEGILYAVKTQRNMRIHIAAAVLVLGTSLFVRLSRTDLVILVLTIGFVFACEIVNTSIEKVVDLVTDKYHPLAKIAKDVAAGAVLVSALCAAAVGYLIFFDRVMPAAGRVIDRIKASPFHITFWSIFIILCIVIGLKILIDPKKVVQGGKVSGHAAVAFSLVTAVILLSKNTLVSFLAFLIGLLVAQSRVEAKIHSLMEVILGAILGILVTYVFFKFYYTYGLF